MNYFLNFALENKIVSRREGNKRTCQTNLKQARSIVLSLEPAMPELKRHYPLLKWAHQRSYLTMNLDMIAFMPCNPSLGGPAKGIVVREIDALGGAMGKVIDKTHIQMRMLNTGKGPAVRALRAQADKVLYQQEMKRLLEEQENLTLHQGVVEELIVEDDEVKGVITQVGAIYRAKTVIITTGTFLRGEVIIGNLKYSSGPNNQMPSIKLADNIRELGFDMVRFKTGTPPRVNSQND